MVSPIASKAELTRASDANTRSQAVPTAAAVATRFSWPWIALLTVLLCTAGLRWRLLDVPLERDEGEYAYIAQQMLQGVPPYQSGYAMKMPGIYAAYALSMGLFGETIRGVHLGASLANLISIFLVFLIARRLYSDTVAVVAAGMFALLTLDPAMQAIGQAEHFVLVPVLAGVWVLQLIFGHPPRSDSPPRGPSLVGLATAGILFGLAPVIKQHGFAFGLFAVWYVLTAWRKSHERRPGALLVQLAALAIGGLLPFAVVCAAMQWMGVFDLFWFWTITYSRVYTSYIPIIDGVVRLNNKTWHMASSMPLVWSAAVFGFSALFWDHRNRSQRAFLLAFGFCSFLAMTPGYYFRAHYFVFLLPVLAMLAAIGCRSVIRLGQPFGKGYVAPEQPLAVGSVCLIIGVLCVWSHFTYLFVQTPDQISHEMYRGNPFPEAVEIAQYIRDHSRESGPIMVLGSEPEIYVYTGRRAASRHIYMYPLMEVHPLAHQMQEELVNQVEQSRPEWIIWEDANAGWLPQPKSETWIFRWINEVLPEHYDRVGVVEVGMDKSGYVWGEDARSYDRKSPVSLSIFQRKR